MHVLSTNPQVPLYAFEADEATGNPYFRVYNLEGSLPSHADLLIPHRKNYYLLAFVRHSDASIWIDMVPYPLKKNTFYFTGPSEIIIKEETESISSVGIAFTKEFLSLQDNTALAKLPLILNPYNGHELILSQTDIAFMEDMIAKIITENQNPGEWQQRMLGAYLSVLLTYLSRLYDAQFTTVDTSVEQLLLKRYQSKIDEQYRELHEVGDYASLLNISAGHLSDVVKSQSGKPAIKHIHERLVLEARRLLFHTNNSLKEIAYELGFTDASYFNRFFKREIGITPADYRSNIRKMYH